MITVNVQSELEKVIRQVGAFDRKQLPFAIAKALTATAKAVEKDTTAAVLTAFDRPTAFTRKAFTIKPARKTDLTAWVFAKDAQARYLAYGIQGGRRRVKGFERRIDAMGGQGNVMLVPTKNVKRDSSGNVSLATIRRIAGQSNSKKYFIGTPKGEGRSFGVYERGKAGTLKALLVETEVNTYRKRLDLMGIGQRVIKKQFTRELQASIAYAMATARK
jgi:hypothetical protein